MTNQKRKFVEQLYVPSVVAVVLWAASFAPPLLALDRPVSSDEQIAAANRPGTVVIHAHWQSTLQFLKGQLDPDGMAELRSFFQEAKKQLLAKRGRRAKQLEGEELQAIMLAILQKLEQNPSHYIIPTTRHMVQPTVSDWGGTGFIITPDGYLVTNAHVVARSSEVDDDLRSNGLKSVILKDLQQFEDALNFDLTQEMKELFAKAELKYYLAFSKLDPPSVEITAEIATAIPGAGIDIRPFPCDVRKQGETSPGKDVAILKIEQRDLPTVPLGDDRKLQIGSHIVVLGYPGMADIQRIFPELAAETGEGMKHGVESTLTQGDLSARKTMPGGWEALQTSAEINHGNSGGPAFNDRGEAIGIATFGPGEKGINFLVPSSVVFEFLNEINVQPQEGRLTHMYRAALADFDAHHYRAALDKFQQINNLNPGFPFVQKYITDAQGEISAGHDRTLPELPYGTIAAVIIALAIVITGAWFLMRKHVPASARATAGVGSAAAASTRVEVAPTSSPGPTAPVRQERNFGSIRCTVGTSPGSRYLISKQGLVIGRDSGKCQIVLSDDAVSKEHAWIVPLDDGVVVIDRGSTNGVYLNSTDSPRISKVRLQHGDRIFIGKGAAVFTYLSN
jgi:serine protease Do